MPFLIDVHFEDPDPRPGAPQMSGLPIRYWLYALVVSVAVPLLVLLGWMVSSEERQVRAEARETALRIAEQVAEELARDQREGRRLLEEIARRAQARPSDDPCDPLFQFVDLFPEYIGIFLQEPDGTILCGSTEGGFGDENPGPPEQVTGITVTREGWVLTLREPIEEGLDARVLSLIQRSSLQNFPRNAVLTIIDRDGVIMARSLDPERWKGRSARGSAVTETVLRERYGRMEARGVDGVLRQYGYTELEGLGWLLYIGVPTEPIMAPVRARMWRTVGAGTAMVVLLALIARALALRISQPLRLLGTASDESVEEVVRVTRNLHGPREVQYLARSFGELMAARKEHEQRLEESEKKLRALSDRLLEIQEEERSRISRAIHDDLGQAITALKMDVGGMSVLLDRDVDQVRRLGRRAEQTLDTLLEGVQRISAELRPPSLDDLGLVAALEQDAALLEERTGIECELSVEPRDIEMPRQIETVVYRIVQEALTNVARHSDATRVEIRLRERSTEFILDIRDDGRGIRPLEIASTSSLGLIGIRERASLAGGEASIEGVEGRGTIIVVKMPKRGDEG